MLGFWVEAFQSQMNIQKIIILVSRLLSLGAKNREGVGERHEAEKHDTETELFPNKKIFESFLRGPVSSFSSSTAYFKFYLN
jgi:hypothetical protein